MNLSTSVQFSCCIISVLKDYLTDPLSVKTKVQMLPGTKWITAGVLSQSQCRGKLVGGGGGGGNGGGSSSGVLMCCPVFIEVVLPTLYPDKLFYYNMLCKIYNWTY